MEKETKPKFINVKGNSTRQFTKESLKNAYLQGYRKRAILGGEVCDEISEQTAIDEFKNWFKNQYE